MNILARFHFFGYEHNWVCVNDRAQQVSQARIRRIGLLQGMVGSNNDVIHNRACSLFNLANRYCTATRYSFNPQ
jgi:hypothetical protein